MYIRDSSGSLSSGGFGTGHLPKDATSRVMRVGRYASDNYSLAAMRVVAQGASQNVWFASIAEVFRLIEPAEVLDAEELAHADRYRLSPDRDRFLAGRSLLRYVLTQRTGGRVPASRWHYRQGSHGKLVMDQGLPALEFNISHAGTCVAAAVGENHPLGVDIERVDPDCGDIIPDVLTERELERLSLFDTDRQRLEFIRLWTVKEACGKALGVGGALDFRAFEVELDPFRPRIRNLLDPTQEFAVSTQTICCASQPYCLSLVTTLSEVTT